MEQIPRTLFPNPILLQSAAPDGAILDRLTFKIESTHPSLRKCKELAAFWRVPMSQILHMSTANDSIAMLYGKPHVGVRALIT